MKNYNPVITGQLYDWCGVCIRFGMVSARVMGCNYRACHETDWASGRIGNTISDNGSLARRRRKYTEVFGVHHFTQDTMYRQ